MYSIGIFTCIMNGIKCIKEKQEGTLTLHKNRFHMCLLCSIIYFLYIGMLLTTIEYTKQSKILDFCTQSRKFFSSVNVGNS